MKLLVKTDKSPVVTFEPNSGTAQVTGSLTAYAIQPNGTLTPLFILNLVGYPAGVSHSVTSPREPVKPGALMVSLQDTSVSARVFLTGMKVAASLTLNK